MGTDHPEIVVSLPRRLPIPRPPHQIGNVVGRPAVYLKYGYTPTANSAWPAGTTIHTERFCRPLLGPVNHHSLLRHDQVLCGGDWINREAVQVAIYAVAVVHPSASLVQ